MPILYIKTIPGHYQFNRREDNPSPPGSSDADPPLADVRFQRVELRIKIRAAIY